MSENTPTLLMAGRMSSGWTDWIRDALDTDWTVLSWSEDDDEFERFTELVPTADAVVAGRMLGGWPAVPNLKVFHIPFTGLDWITPADMPKGCVVCNTFEHEIAIAEYTLAGMLEWEVQLCEQDRRFRTHRWENRQPGAGPGRGELFGKTLGIVGYGHIGKETQKRAQAFGMRTIAVSRRTPPAPELDWFGTIEELDRLLAESDYVLVTLPLSDETESLFNTARFSAMKSDVVIINVGRGRVLDEKDLYEALKSKRIGGAVIDVWYDYPTKDDPDPTPSKFPFHELDNLIMTPHSSARSEAMRQRRWAFVAANLDRFARGEAMENIVFEGTA